MGKFDKEELRQRAAIAAMQSLVAKVIGDANAPVRVNEPGDIQNINIRNAVGNNAEWVAFEALRYANKLVEQYELDKEEQKKMETADKNDEPTPNSLIEKKQ